MSICNFCTLQRMRKRARKKGLRIVTRRIQPKSREDWGMGGLDIHLLKKGEKPTNDNRKAWFMELTAHCVC